MSAKVSVQPAVRFGAPCIDGTSLDVDLVVSHYLSLGLDETLISWPHIDRDSVLVACWYVARYRKGKSKSRAILKAWLAENEEAMWKSTDWSKVPLPPRVEP